MNILLYLFLNIFLTISPSDINNPNTSCLLLIVYETEEYRCPSCELIKQILNEKKIEYKLINFIKELNVSARFSEIKFPSIFFKNRKDFYKIPIELLEEITNENLYDICVKKKYKIKKFFAPNSMFSAVVGFIFAKGFPIYLSIKGYMDELHFVVLIFLATVIFALIFYMTKLEDVSKDEILKEDSEDEEISKEDEEILTDEDLIAEEEFKKKLE